MSRILIGAVKLVIIAIPLGMIGLFAFSVLNDPGSQTRSSSSQFHSKPIFDAPEQARPDHGYAQRYSSEPYQVPLELSVIGTNDYFLYVRDGVSGDLVADFYIHAASTLKTELPLGTYIIRYAAGSTWFGPTHRFGPDTIYGELLGALEFSQDGQRFSGHSIELAPVRRGNLRTKPISGSEF